MDTRRYVSVKFDPVGRAHTFLLPDIEFEAPLQPGDPVVVARGDSRAYGSVTRASPPVAERKAPPGDAPQCVLRKATKQDVATRLKHEHLERDALRIGGMKILEHGVPMKLVRVEQLFDASRLVFYFTADGRVDFRALVRELAAEFRCRIEMRQIGARDEAKLLGGYGNCGRPLCCTTWLRGFEPISIKMAKRQSLSLNPSRLSGPCGRLKCCLRYELPNAAGEQFAGCAHESSCGRAGDGYGSGGCADCGSRGCATYA
jgi:cell fate regulator YaaT (PSP1 superfamily)